MFKTVADIMEDVKYEMSLVPGSDVDEYSQPQIERSIYNAYKFLFGKRNWAHLILSHTATLDEQAGLMTADFDGLERYDDIVDVRKSPYSEQDIIPLDKYTHPSRITELCWRPLDYKDAAFATRVIKFYPVTTAATVQVFYKRFEKSFASADLVPFDYNLILHWVCSNILAKDGMNDSAKVEHETLFNQFYEDIVSNDPSRDKIIFGASTTDSFTVAE